MKFQIYPDKSGEWRWRLWNTTFAGVQSIVATSHQGHTDKAKCKDDIECVIATGLNTPIDYL